MDIVRFVADYSYEMFLVHWPIVVLFVRMIHLPLPWALGSRHSSPHVVAAIALHRGVLWNGIARRAGQRLSPAPFLIRSSALEGPRCEVAKRCQVGLQPASAPPRSRPELRGCRRPNCAIARAGFWPGKNSRRLPSFPVEGRSEQHQ